MEVLFQFNQRKIIIESKNEKDINTLNKMFGFSLGKYYNNLNFINEQYGINNHITTNFLKKVNYFDNKRKKIVFINELNNYINIKYKLSSIDKKYKRVLIFGDSFVMNNYKKNNFYIEYKNRKYK